MAAIRVIASPIKSDEINENGLVRSIKTEVNCKMGMYNNAKTTNLRISDIVVILPLNQLLSREPANIVANPIQSKVIVPWIKLPMIILFVMIFAILGCCEMRSTGTLDSPFTIETTIISTPAKAEKILINPEGVGLPKELNALSRSKALIMKAIPRMLKTKATASLVNPKIVEIPATTRRAPGTPRKNFEYRGSYTSILIYLPRIA